MKKLIYLIFTLAVFLCACASTSPQEPAKQIEATESANPEICITKNAIIKYLGSHTEVIKNTPHGTLYVDFNYENTGSEANSMHFSVLIKAFQDGVEIKHFNFPSEQLLPGYNKTYSYEFDLHNTESPVLIQYCTYGKSKVISEFTIDITP